MHPVRSDGNRGGSICGDGAVLPVAVQSAAVLAVVILSVADLSLPNSFFFHLNIRFSWSDFDHSRQSGPSNIVLLTLIPNRRLSSIAKPGLLIDWKSV